MLSKLRNPAKAATAAPEIPPISKRPEFATIEAKVSELQARRAAKVRQRNELFSDARARDHIARLSTAYLDGEAIPAPISPEEQSRTLSDEIRGLDQALDLAQRERGRLQSVLSAEVLSTMKPRYRELGRDALRGLIALYRANDAVVKLREQLEASGYRAGGLVPCAVSPWPIAGELRDPASPIRCSLRDMTAAGFVSPSEADELVRGTGTLEP